MDFRKEFLSKILLSQLSALDKGDLKPVDELANYLYYIYGVLLERSYLKNNFPDEDEEQTKAAMVELLLTMYKSEYNREGTCCIVGEFIYDQEPLNDTIDRIAYDLKMAFLDEILVSL